MQKLIMISARQLVVSDISNSFMKLQPTGGGPNIEEKGVVIEHGDLEEPSPIVYSLALSNQSARDEK